MRRLRPSQAKVRSTIQRCGEGWKPGGRIGGSWFARMPPCAIQDEDNLLLWAGAHLACELGQFTSADPAGDGLNHYSYVHDSPETLTDPTGLWTFGFCAAGVGAYVAGVTGEVCVAIGFSGDSGLSYGLTETGGGGNYYGEGAAGGPGVQISNADTVKDLGGPFGFAGGAVAVGPGGAGANVFAGRDNKDRLIVGLDLQYLFGADISAGVGVTETAVQSQTIPNPSPPDVNPMDSPLYRAIWNWLRQFLPSPLPSNSGGTALGSVAGLSKTVWAVTSGQGRSDRNSMHAYLGNPFHARSRWNVTSTIRRQISAMLRYRSLFQRIRRRISALFG
jgi:hypothetical protein